MCAEPAREPDALSVDDLFRHHPQPMWLVDVPSLRLIDVNLAALERYRLERAAFLARSLPEMWVAGAPRLTAATADPHVLAAAVSGPAMHRRGDGSVLSVRVEARPLGAGGGKRLLVVAQEDPGALAAGGANGNAGRRPPGAGVGRRPAPRRGAAHQRLQPAGPRAAGGGHGAARGARHDEPAPPGGRADARAAGRSHRRRSDPRRGRAATPRRRTGARRAGAQGVARRPRVGAAGPT